MDVSVAKDVAVTLGGGGVFVFCLWQLVSKLLSGTQTAVAADDKTKSLMDRMEEQSRTSQERYIAQLTALDERQAAETARYVATIQRLEERADMAIARADRAEQERNQALMQVAELSRTIDALKTEIMQLKDKVESYGRQRTQD